MRAFSIIRLNNVYKVRISYKTMKKKTIKILQIIAWTIGFVALALLIYGIIKALI